MKQHRTPPADADAGGRVVMFVQAASAERALELAGETADTADVTRHGGVLNEPHLAVWTIRRKGK